MLNNFTYQLELNELNKANTKLALKDKIAKYNRESFRVSSGHKLEMYLPWYTNTINTEKVLSKILNFQLLQLALTKYAELFDIQDLPQYAQHLHKINFTITLKDNPNG